MKKFILQNIFLYLTILQYSFFCHAQEKQNLFITAPIGFYNLENLHDTIFDSDARKILQDEYTPNGNYKWNTEKYNKKLSNLAKVIYEMGMEVNPAGLAILGVAEVENKNVLEDLVKTDSLKFRNYKIIHFDSPDKRGIDVGLLYNPACFKPTNSVAYKLHLENDSNFFTRDQLLVSGFLYDELIHVIVAHWPSRSGGEKRTAPKRIAAAKLGIKIIDSLLQTNPNAKIIYMGDLNDDPTNESVKKHLGTSGNIENMLEKTLYNPMEKLHKNGIGTLAFRDNWNLFDQLIISSALLGKDYNDFKFYNAKIFNKVYLTQTSGAFTGYPLRTHAGGVYTAGYSDHFPVYLVLTKKAKK